MSASRTHPFRPPSVLIVENGSPYDACAKNIFNRVLAAQRQAHTSRIVVRCCSPFSCHDNDNRFSCHQDTIIIIDLIIITVYNGIVWQALISTRALRQPQSIVYILQIVYKSLVYVTDMCRGGRARDLSGPGRAYSAALRPITNIIRNPRITGGRNGYCRCRCTTDCRSARAVHGDKFSSTRGHALIRSDAQQKNERIVLRRQAKMLATVIPRPGRWKHSAVRRSACDDVGCHLYKWCESAIRALSIRLNCLRHLHMVT